MSVAASVRSALAGSSADGWQLELAFALAEAMDDSPSASTAKELRTLMDSLGASGAEVVGVEGDVSDDLAAQRERRRKAAGS